MDNIILFLIFAIVSVLVGIVILKVSDSYQQSLAAKISFKITGAYTLTAILVGAAIYLIVGIATVTTEEMAESVEKRMEKVDEDLEGNSYFSASRTLLEESCYEPEFDYAWERLLMQDSYNHYLIRKVALEELTASGGDEARIEQVKKEMELYKQELLELCANSKDAKNVPYVQNYELKLSE